MRLLPQTRGPSYSPPPYLCLMCFACLRVLNVATRALRNLMQCVQAQLCAVSPVSALPFPLKKAFLMMDWQSLRLRLWVWRRIRSRFFCPLALCVPV